MPDGCVREQNCLSKPCSHVLPSLSWYGDCSTSEGLKFLHASSSASMFVFTAMPSAVSVESSVRAIRVPIVFPFSASMATASMSEVGNLGLCLYDSCPERNVGYGIPAQSRVRFISIASIPWHRVHTCQSLVLASHTQPVIVGLGDNARRLCPGTVWSEQHVFPFASHSQMV